MRALLLAAAAALMGCATTSRNVHVAAGAVPHCSRPEAELGVVGVLQELANAGVETAILVRIEELPPRILVAFSLPFLWFGASEADSGIRAIHRPSRSVLLDGRIERVTGGPFHLRPPAGSEEKLVRALEQVLAGWEAS